MLRQALCQVRSSLRSSSRNDTSSTIAPIIDLSDTRRTDRSLEYVNDAKLEAGRQIDAACSSSGFFQLVNHGVSEQPVQRAWAIMREFFDMPADQKQLVPMTDEYPYGYSGFGDEVLAQAWDEAEEPVAADLKESWQICLGPPGRKPQDMHIAPQWPTAAPEGFQEAVTAYYREMEALSTVALECCALGLGVPKDFFKPYCTEHISALRVLNYPHVETPPQPGQLRATEHTDYGALTLLMPDDAPGGLQVKHRDGAWVTPVLEPGAFTVNVGDMMARWTNDRWVSTPHRVVVPEPGEGAGERPLGNRRQSAAFFFNINPDSVVECIPTCADQAGASKYNPVVAGEYLMAKHSIAMSQGASVRVEDVLDL